jgi:uncharacterized membrane protein YbhN (UPF0104 family)
MKRFLFRVISILVVIVILGFLVLQVARNWQQVRQYQWQASPGGVVVSFLLLLAALGLDVVIWMLALRMFESPLGFRAAARVWFPALIARYIPGKVASLGVRIWLSHREGVSPYRAGAAAFFEVILRIMAALIVFGLSLPFWPIFEGRDRLVALLVIIPVGLVALHPRLLQRAFNLGLRLLKRPAVAVPFRFQDVLLLLAVLCGRWILYGVAFAQFAAAVAPNLRGQTPAIIGMASVAWAAGFLLQMPAGLGVNEWVLREGLRQYLGSPAAAAVAIATAVALLARLWTVAGEVTWLAAVPLLKAGSREQGAGIREGRKQ